MFLQSLIKTLAASLIAAATLAACGGSDSSTSTPTKSDAEQPAPVKRCAP